jgi:CBS domain-containing protein
MIAKVKAHKAGFVRSDTTVHPASTLRDLLATRKRTGHSTAAVTEDGTNAGKFLGIITEKDFWEYEDNLDTPVSDHMTPLEKVIHGRVGITLTEANRLLHRHKKECLPVLEHDGRLNSLVFKKDYVDHMNNPNELLDAEKRLAVGAGINTTIKSAFPRSSKPALTPWRSTPQMATPNSKKKPPCGSVNDTATRLLWGVEMWCPPKGSGISRKRPNSTL